VAAIFMVEVWENERLSEDGEERRFVVMAR
jgi:hypothetical protein